MGRRPNNPEIAEVVDLAETLRRRTGATLSGRESIELAIRMLELRTQRDLVVVVRSAGDLGAKVLEVLLKQYSRLALATHDGGAS